MPHVFHPTRALTLGKRGTETRGGPHSGPRPGMVLGVPAHLVTGQARVSPPRAPGDWVPSSGEWGRGSSTPGLSVLLLPETGRKMRGRLPASVPPRPLPGSPWAPPGNAEEAPPFSPPDSHLVSKRSPGAPALTPCPPPTEVVWLQE